jgi:hypothetical protein
MGSICSKSSVQEGGHTLLGSGPVNPAAPTRPNPAPSDPRTAALQAAERRIQAVSDFIMNVYGLLEFVCRLNEGVQMKQTPKPGNFRVNWRNRIPPKQHPKLNKKKGWW